MKKKDKIIATVLVVLIVIVFVGGQIKNSREKFTREKWINYEGSSRQLILDDFAGRNTVGGMTREEVEQTMGHADEETEDHMIYYVGVPQNWLGHSVEGAEEEFLVYSFDEEGKVYQLDKLVRADLPEGSRYRSEPAEETKE